METIKITENILNNKVANKPSRFDMAINFYCCVKKDNKYYLVGYYYNPKWNMYYPFYDDINKTPIFKQSNSNTYQELINETNQTININLKEKLKLAHERFFELFKCKCKTIKSKNEELYELKFSKTANVYTIYKLYNYIITEVDDIKNMLNPTTLQCKLFDIDNLKNTQIVDNAKWFSKLSLEELKSNAIELK